MLQCFPLDNTEYEAAALGAWFATRTRGVLSSGDNFAVIASGTGMSVTLQPGYGWLRRDAHWGTVVWMEKPETFILDPADDTLSRIDVIALRLDKDNNTAQPILRKGTFSSAPTFTAPVRDTHADEVYAASILVQPGAVKILQSDVTDLRLNETYCGIMRDGITGIPTAQLQAQVQQLIDHLRAEVDGIEQGSEVMLKTVYDADGDGVVDRAAAADRVAKKFILQNNAGQQMAEFDGSADRTVQLTPGQVGAEPAFTKNTAFNKNFGTAAGTVCQGNDGRLSNARRASNISMGYDGNLWISYS